MKVDRKKASLAAITLFLTSAPIFAYPYATSSPGQAIVALSWYVVFFSVFLAISSRSIADDWFDFYPLFMLATFLFNLSYPVIYAFGLVDFGPDFLSRGVDDRLVVTTIVMTVLFVGAFHTGAIFGYTETHKRSSPPYSQSNSVRGYKNQEKALRVAGIIVLLVALPGAVSYFSHEVGAVLEGGYAAFWDPESATYGAAAWNRIVAGLLVPAVFMLLVGGRNHRGSRTLAAVILIGYCLVFLIIGRRAMPVMALLSFGVIWHMSISRIKGYWLAVGICLALIAFPVIQEVRNDPAKDAIQRTGQSTVQKVSMLPVDAVQEMGRTLRTVYWGIESVPADHEYRLGGSYIWALTTVFPNLFWGRHPASQRGVGDWMSEKYQPNLAARGGGVGSSFVAEAYVNFGWMGWLACLAMGFALQELVGWGKRKSPARLMVLGSVFASVFILARGETLSVVRDLVWYSVFPYVAFVLLYKLWRVLPRRVLLSRATAVSFDKERGV